MSIFEENVNFAEDDTEEVEMNENEEVLEDDELSTEELDSLAGGAGSKYHVDMYDTRYCPYHRKKEMSIVRLKEKHKFKGKSYSFYYCSKVNKYFFETTTAYYNLNNDKLMDKKK